MKPPTINAERGLTRLEVTILVIVIAVLAFLFLGAWSGAKRLANGSACLNNLKYIGLGLLTFSTDNGGRFPMQESVTNGGTREWLADESQLWRHWGALTNGLRSPKYLLCPSDRRRQPSFNTVSPTTWDQFTNNAFLSYFLGLVSNDGDPESITAGDRNVVTNGIATGAGRLVLTTNMVVSFSENELHRGLGKLLFADGRAETFKIKQLDAAWFAARTNSSTMPKVWLVP